ncbi:Cytosolic phospholipase A2 zeta [Phlyctochytrium planicorne]|nr:Cytosolic phospholipase A2 zeta [Phlyctochytrium planicorne]
MVGVVQVRVLRAKDLTKKDFFTQNDAFVELWLNKHYKQKTTVIQSSLPEWNQTFTLNYEHNEHTVYFHVLDKDLMDTDGIGYANFDFNHLRGRPGQPETKELTLKAHALDFTPNGYLTVEVTSESVTEVNHGKAHDPKCTQSDRENLEQCSWDSCSQVKSTYVEIWINDDYKRKTTVMQCSDPEWNHTFIFNYKPDDNKLHFNIIEEVNPPKLKQESISVSMYCPGCLDGGDDCSHRKTRSAEFDFSHLKGRADQTESKEFVFENDDDYIGLYQEFFGSAYGLEDSIDIGSKSGNLHIEVTIIS